jgi:hypothetical protein
MRLIIGREPLSRVFKWQQGYSDVRVLIKNTSDEPYVDLDVLLQTDTSIIAVGIISDFNTCKVSPGMSLSPIALMKGADGKTLADVGTDSPENVSINSHYRVRCDRFAPHTRACFQNDLSQSKTAATRTKLRKVSASFS